MAALMFGWPLIEKEFPNIQLEFIGSPGKSIEDLEVKDGYLVPSTEILQTDLKRASSSSAKIEGSFDLYLLCGMGLSKFKVLQIYQNYRAECQTEDKCTPISDDCFFQASVGCLRESIAVGVLTKLRRITAAPVALIPVPMLSGINPKGKFQHPEENGDDSSVAAFFASACDQIASDLQSRFIRQPVQTLESALTTKSEYSHAPARFLLKHPQSDRNHMNADYGAIALREALIAMRATDF